MAYQVGDKVGDYQVTGILGAGGMGQVYKVRNLISERDEAMKVLLPDLANFPDLEARFLREIKVLASLNHPNIAALRTALRVGNQLIMIMEFVEGQTLADKLKGGPVPLDEAIESMAQVLSALSYAHSQGVIHRDIKPANMMETPGGLVKLMDFGIAKSAADRKLTMTGGTLGSLHYMSPEQVEGKDLDARSDLYSLGASFYEIVTGARPFQGESDFALMTAHLQKVPPPPIQIDPNLPQALSDVIVMALTKDPANRFQTADAFRRALESIETALPATTAKPGAQSPMAAPQPAGAPPTASMIGAPPPRFVPSSTSNPIPSPVSSVASAPRFQQDVPRVEDMAPPRSYRGFYMTIGALIAIAVIIVVATQLPKWRKTSAGSNTQKTAQVRGSQAQIPSPDSQAAKTALSTAEPAGATVSTDTQANANPTGPAPDQPSGNSGAVSQQTAANAGAPASPDLLMVHRPSRKATSGHKDVQQVQQSSDQSAAVAGAADTSAAAQNQVVQSAQANAGAELEELQDRWTKLDARASTAQESIDRLRQQQEASGLGLRGDIAGSLKRMQTYMNQAQNALSASDAAKAKRNLDLAEPEVDKLEAFLGR